MSTNNVVPFSNILSSFEQAANNQLDLPSILPATTPSVSTQTATNPTGTSPSAIGSGLLSGISSFLFGTRAVAIILGLIAIAGALFLFGVDEIGGVFGATKTVARGAEIL